MGIAKNEEEQITNRPPVRNEKVSREQERDRLQHDDLTVFGKQSKVEGGKLVLGDVLDQQHAGRWNALQRLRRQLMHVTVPREQIQDKHSDDV